MLVNLDKSFIKNKVVGVAVSGGSDSMALLEYLYSIKDLYSFSIIAINVEHGIRGESSVNDTEFVNKLFNGSSYTINHIEVNRFISCDGKNRQKAKEVLIYVTYS